MRRLPRMTIMAKYFGLCDKSVSMAIHCYALWIPKDGNYKLQLLTFVAGAHAKLSSVPLILFGVIFQFTL